MTTRRGAVSTGPAPEAKAQIEQILRTTGGTPAIIAELVGCSREMVYKTMREHREDVEVVGFEGKAKIVRLRTETWPFSVGEWVEVVEEKLNGKRERVALLRGMSGATYEVVVG